MAGSFSHAVDKDGKLLNPTQLNGMLENGGDVYEGVEEMYGMIYWLANAVVQEGGYHGSAFDAAYWVEEARKDYKTGLEYSPGTDGQLDEEPE